MSHRAAMKVLGWLAVSLVLALLVSDALARGGRGGGGRSMSRGGAASRGSFGGSRGGYSSRGSSMSRGSYSRGSSMGGYSRQPSRTPSQRPSTQPGQARPSQRPSTPATERPTASPRPSTPGADRPTASPRPSTPVAGGSDRPTASQREADRERPSDPDREGAREDWQDHRQEMQDDRQEAAQERQAWRQENAEDFWEEGYGYYGPAYWHGGIWVGDWDEVYVYHVDDDEGVEWAGVVAGFALGTVISAATFQSATTDAGCALNEVQVEGQTYYRCGSTWYVRAMQEGEVRYMVVPAPPTG